MDDIYLSKIIEKIKRDRNLDFSGYRMKLLKRRVLVRVRSTKCNDLKDYLRYLEGHLVELDELLNAMTINVTEFFRDSHVFDVIEKRLIPDLISQKKASGSNALRIWSCACASGEEAYSVFMDLAEYLGSKLSRYDVNILGTDIDNNAVTKAKKGVYDEAQLLKLSDAQKDKINKYFYDVGNGKYWIHEEWPKYFEFKYHDIITDEPLDNVDVIFCRNVLMYFSRELQEQVIRRLLESLNTGGYLVLGNVESLMGDLKEKFSEYDSRARIYIKK